jgi:hypothetical protein
MRADPIQVLRGDSPAKQRPHRPRLVIAGATGTMGHEVVRRLAGQFGATQVLAREAITDALGSVTSLQVPGDSPDAWLPAPCDIGIVLFDPPRLFFDRERALWTPRPDQMLEVARWLRRSGANTIAIVLPHAQGRLPEALKRGLASLDEHAVATLGFDRLIMIRTAQKPGGPAAGGALARIARGMLSVFHYMLPSSEQPVRAVKVAELLSAALRLAPPGIHIAAPELVWRAAQGDVQQTAREWLAR